MKEINGYWVDDYNNKWDNGIYGLEDAEALSETLINCRDCHNCRDCNDCSNCRNFETNPSRFITENITFYYYKNEIYVVCDFFRGDLKEFEKKVSQTHGDNEFVKQCAKEIKKIKILFEVK
jgi:hypothetical protein